MAELVVALSGRIIGAITQVGGRPRFTYIDEYAEDPDATPLSLSMPLAIGKSYDHRITAPWLSNLLPDDDQVRENWARELGVSAVNATELLEHVGHDVAGAVQLAAPAELENVLARQGSLEVVSEASIGKRLRDLVSHPSHWANPDEGGVSPVLNQSSPQPERPIMNGRGHTVVHLAPTSSNLVSGAIQAKPSTNTFASARLSR